MKILMTVDVYLPSLGGAEYHVYYLRRELLKMGHQVQLCTFTEAIHSEDAGTVTRIPYRGIKSLLPMFRALWVEAGKADFIHAHHSYRLSFLAATVAFLRRKPLIITQHGLGLLPQAGGSFLQNIIFRIWRRWSMTVARTVISTSDDLSIDIRKLGFGKKILHIPNGYDPSRFPFLPAPKNSAPVLLTVRRLVPKTGIQYLIAALPALRTKHPGIRCICVGDGRYKDQLTGLAQSLGVADAVEFAGAVDHAGVMRYYEQADVVVFPSTAESTSLACIEAMALGKIVVASRVGGLIELLAANEERGTLVALTENEHCDYNAPLRIPAERIARLSAAIDVVLSYPEQAYAKARIASEYAKTQYAWPHLAERTVSEVYAKITESCCSRI